MTMAHNGRHPIPNPVLDQSRSYGFKIRHTTTVGGSPVVGDDILYRSMRFSVTRFHRMGIDWLARSETCYGKELVMVRIGADQGVDVQQVPPIGWSFLDDERNQFAVNGRWWLYEGMFVEPQLKERFVDQSGQVKKKPAAAYHWSVEQFRELLFALKMLSSQPPRVPELFGMR